MDARPIPCLSGRYFATRDGQIIGPRGHRLSARLNRTGRVIVTVFAGSAEGMKTMQVHRLVVDAFLGLEPGLQVNHINGNPADNRVENLELVTASKNTLHAYRVLGVGRAKPVVVTYPSGVERQHPTGRAAAADIGVDQSTLSGALKHGRRVRGHAVRFA